MAEGLPPPEGDQQPQYVPTEPIGERGHGHAFVFDPGDPQAADAYEEHLRQHPDQRVPRWQQQPMEQHGQRDHGSAESADAGTGGAETTPGRETEADGSRDYYKGRTTAAEEDAARARRKAEEAEERLAAEIKAREKIEEARAEAVKNEAAATAATAAATAATAAAKRDAAEAARLRGDAEAARLRAEREAQRLRDAEAQRIRDEHRAEMDRLRDEALVEDAHRTAMAERVLSAADIAALADPADRQREQELVDGADRLGDILENAIRFKTLTVRGVRGQLGERPMSDDQINSITNAGDQAAARNRENAAQLLALRTVQELLRQGVITSGYARVNERILAADTDDQLTEAFDRTRNGGWPGHMEPTQAPASTMDFNGFVGPVRGRRPSDAFMGAFRQANGEGLTHDGTALRRTVDTRGEIKDAKSSLMEPQEQRERRILDPESTVTQADIVQIVLNELEPQIVMNITGTRMNFLRAGSSANPDGRGRMNEYTSTLAASQIAELVEQYFAATGHDPVHVMHDRMDELMGARGAGTIRTDLPGRGPYEKLASDFLQQVRGLNITRKAAVSGVRLPDGRVVGNVNGTPVDGTLLHEEPADKREKASREVLVDNEVDIRRRYASDTLVKAFRELELRYEENRRGGPSRMASLAERAEGRGLHNAASTIRRLIRRR